MFRLLQKWLVRFTYQDDIDCMSTRRSAGEFWLEIDARRHWIFLDIDGVLHRAENGSLEFMPVDGNYPFHKLAYRRTPGDGAESFPCGYTRSDCWTQSRSGWAGE